MNTDFYAFEVINRKGESATRPLARLVGRPTLWLRRNSPMLEIFIGSFSLLLAGMSLPRPQGIPIPAAPGPYRRFAPAIPPKRTNSLVQLRFQG
jgi:hypothetical protein